MGFNSTVVVMNDALDMIRDDPEFGRRLHNAIMSRAMSRNEPIDVAAASPSGCRCYANAATVIESHHADITAIVTVGGNSGSVLGLELGWQHSKPEDKIRIVKALYDQYVLAPRRKLKQAKKKEGEQHVSIS